MWGGKIKGRLKEWRQRRVMNKFLEMPTISSKCLSSLLRNALPMLRGTLNFRRRSFWTTSSLIQSHSMTSNDHWLALHTYFSVLILIFFFTSYWIFIFNFHIITMFDGRYLKKSLHLFDRSCILNSGIEHSLIFIKLSFENESKRLLWHN